LIFSPLHLQNLKSLADRFPVQIIAAILHSKAYLSTLPPDLKDAAILSYDISLKVTFRVTFALVRLAYLSHPPWRSLFTQSIGSFLRGLDQITRLNLFPFSLCPFLNLILVPFYPFRAYSLYWPPFPSRSCT
jgi:hypothetical protein